MLMMCQTKLDNCYVFVEDAPISPAYHSGMTAGDTSPMVQMMPAKSMEYLPQNAYRIPDQVGVRNCSIPA